MTSPDHVRSANLAPPDSAMQDVEDARVRLERALGPGGALRRHLVVESGRPDSIGLRDPVHLESSRSAWLSDEVVLSSDSRLVKTRDVVDHGSRGSRPVAPGRDSLKPSRRHPAFSRRCPVWTSWWAFPRTWPDAGTPAEAASRLGQAAAERLTVRDEADFLVAALACAGLYAQAGSTDTALRILDLAHEAATHLDWTRTLNIIVASKKTISR